MELGRFSVSLTVKNIAKSKAFYETLDFVAHPDCGSVEDKWLIMEHGSTIIGLFEGMFDSNILTFNPQNVREIAKHIEDNGIKLETAPQGESGPAHCILNDPDGNTIMFDQF